MQQTSGGSMSGKVRVYEVAKQLNLDPKQVVGLFQAIGVAEVRNHMSSVEPEAVERVKRHLEKQRTHDVVEERIRTDGRVVKRRAVAKPGAAVAPAEPPAALPRVVAPPASARALERSIEEAPAQPQETNGHAPEPAAVDGEVARPTSREDRASAAANQPSPAPRERSSARSLPSVE